MRDAPEAEKCFAGALRLPYPRAERADFGRDKDMRQLLAALLIVLAGPALADDLPLIDAHIHYSHDAVELVPPEEAAAILRKAGLRRALVSSSDDDGTQKLFAAAPDIVVPELRPYRRRGEISTWMHDPTVIDYVEGRLERFKYVAIGEFHAYGDDIETPVLQRMIALAREHNLLLHAHSDADAIDRIFKSWPEAIVLWAHAGFARPQEVAAVLVRHRNLWADLAFRSDQATGDEVAPEWLKLFEEFPDRFMVGTDTFTPERWYYVADHAAYSRGWLESLPRELAEKIAFRNSEAMLAHVAPVPELSE